MKKLSKYEVVWNNAWRFVYDTSSCRCVPIYFHGRIYSNYSMDNTGQTVTRRGGVISTMVVEEYY